MQTDNAAFTAHSTRKIQIFEKIKIAETSESSEHVPADKDCLIAQKPAASPRADASEHARAAEEPGGRNIAPRKTSSNHITLSKYPLDACETIMRQSCIGAKKSEN